MKTPLLAIFFLIPTAAASAAPDTFDTFKSFAGKWSIQSGAKTLPIEMAYDTGSKNTIVTEQFGRELSVFYRDGNNLLMTHFCNAGNQPRLRLRPGTPPGTYEFDMFDITNLPTPSAAHVHKAIYHLLDNHTLTLELVWLENGTETSENYMLHRK